VKIGGYVGVLIAICAWYASVAGQILITYPVRTTTTGQKMRH
jgi:succinate-acetate transporter protein